MSKNQNTVSIPVMKEIEVEKVNDALDVTLMLKKDTTNNYIGMAFVTIPTTIDNMPINAKFTLYRPTKKAKEAGYHGRIGWVGVKQGNDLAYTTSTSKSNNNVYANETTFSPAWRTIIDKKVEAKLAEEFPDVPTSIKKSKPAVNDVAAKKSTEVTEEVVDSTTIEESAY